MAKKTILILDDSASMRATVSITLNGAGYEVIEAKDGNEGLSKLSGLRVNLIISDVNMPGMDGITFLKKLKEQAAHRYVPVITNNLESNVII
jgi:two-component system chemotaxis response regulator CheY